jgi:two-component system, LytTR family, response regulator
MTTALRVLVVDDERPARAHVLRLLRNDPRFQCVGEASNGLEALQRIDETTPDVMILDIQMPGLNGFEVLGALATAPPLTVIFSTAHDDHALRAFEAHAADYLLKPYGAQRFQRALDKAHALQRAAPRAHDALLEDALPAPRETLTVRSLEGHWLSLPVCKISRLYAVRKWSCVVMGQREQLVRHSFGELVAKLDGRFARVHRSMYVRLAAVTQVEPWTHGDLIVSLEDGTTQIVTRTQRKDFMARLEAR